MICTEVMSADKDETHIAQSLILDDSIARILSDFLKETIWYAYHI